MEDMISLEEYKKMKLEFKRTSRTNTSEEYCIFSDNPNAGAKLPKESLAASRVGHFILLFIPSTDGKTFFSGTLILEAKWEEDAIKELISYLEDNYVNILGYEREDFAITVYYAEEIGFWSDIVTDDTERGTYGLFMEFRELKRLLEEMKARINESPEILETIIDKNYDKIKSIIELTEDENRKNKLKEVLSSEFAIGIQKGLPSLYYTRKSEKKK